MRILTNLTTSRLQFLNSLCGDLNKLGMISKVTVTKGTVLFSSELDNAVDLKKLNNLLRRSQLAQRQGFIQKLQHEVLQALIIDGSKLEIEKIKPKLVRVKDRKDSALFRYVQLAQNLPITHRNWRRLRYLIFDEGQKTPTLMGAIGLASSTYTIAPRDRYLEWKSGDKAKAVGLNRLMDLYTCAALPPYNMVLGGKLLAALALSDEVRSAHQVAYGQPLLAVVTTCSSGLHCPIFTDIFVTGYSLYNKIGMTQGYSTVFFSSDTFEAARQLVQNEKSNIAAEDGQLQKTIRLMRYALRICNINPESLLKLGNPKAVYLAAVDRSQVESLQNGTLPKGNASLSSTEIVSFWRERILPRRLRQLPHMASMRSFVSSALFSSLIANR